MSKKTTTITWHSASESPGKRTVLMAFKVKDHEHEHYTFSAVTFHSSDVTPATVHFKTSDGTKKLAVAWAYHDEVVKGITEEMFRQAESDAWAWWPEGKPDGK